MTAAHAAPASPKQADRGWVFTALLLLWWFGGYGLVVWGTVAGRGPFAFLLTWQTEAFGGSSMILDALVGAVIIFWAPPLLGRVAGHVWPASPAVARYNQRMHLAMMSRGEAAARARMVWAQMDEVAKRRSLIRRRNGALIVAAVLLAATAAGNITIGRIANADAGRPLRQVVLGSSAPLLSADASPWVRILGAHPLMDGVMQRDYSIRTSRYRDFYTPLVPDGWRSGMPVALVEMDQTFPDDHDPSEIADPPGAIEGELSAGGPRPDIAALFRRYGYAVDDTTVVLTRKQDLHGVIPGEDPFLAGFIWWMGGFFVFMALLVAGLAERQRRRL